MLLISDLTFVTNSGQGPESSHRGFTIPAYLVSDIERYRDTVTDTALPAGERLMILATGATPTTVLIFFGSTIDSRWLIHHSVVDCFLLPRRA